MDDPEKEFSALVSAVLVRFFAQNGRGVTDVGTVAVGERLWGVVMDRGRPAPLAPGEIGTPGGMSEEECAPLVARVLGGAAPDPLLSNAVKQLVKACFYPEFSICRDSYREVASDGGCRRQELARALTRVSGSHCVDCPYWTALDRDQHGKLLAEAWVAGADTWARGRAVFLPEDFRELRRWLHGWARR